MSGNHCECYKKRSKKNPMQNHKVFPDFQVSQHESCLKYIFNSKVIVMKNII